MFYDDFFGAKITAEIENTYVFKTHGISNAMIMDTFERSTTVSVRFVPSFLTCWKSTQGSQQLYWSGYPFLWEGVQTKYRDLQIPFRHSRRITTYSWQCLELASKVEILTHSIVDTPVYQQHVWNVSHESYWGSKNYWKWQNVICILESKLIVKCS